MSRVASFKTAFDARLAALEALLAARSGRFTSADGLRDQAGVIDAITPFYEATAVGVAYAAFAELLRIAALLVEWRTAVLAGEAEAVRYLKAAQARRTLWMQEATRREWIGDALEASATIETLEDVSTLGAVFAAFAGVALPIGIYGKEPRDRVRATSEPEAPKADLVVAFLSFAVDGQPAAETHFIPPGESHDLELEVRITRWPDGADHLELRPLSVEAAGTYEFPVFKLSRPKGDPPFVLRERGRAVIKTSQGLNARPFEFRYAAVFEPIAVEQPVSVLGQRTLRIEAIDLKVNSLSGHAGLDQKIIALRDRLRSRYNIPPDDLTNTLKLVSGLANLMSRALQDNEIPEALSEKEFQALVRKELRRRTDIGTELSEHPAAAGGLTDLALHGVPLELKSERVRRLTLADCQPYLAQTTSYAVANGKRIGVLCVLDGSPKTQVVMPAEEGLDLMFNGGDENGVPIVTMLVQGNLARPSALRR